MSLFSIDINHIYLFSYYFVLCMLNLVQSIHVVFWFTFFLYLKNVDLECRISNYDFKCIILRARVETSSISFSGVTICCRFMLRWFCSHCSLALLLEFYSEGLKCSGWTGFQCWTTNVSHRPTVEPRTSTLHRLGGKPEETGLEDSCVFVPLEEELQLLLLLHLLLV